MSHGDDIFQAFLAWLPMAMPAGDVRAMLGQYRQALMAQGHTEKQAGEHIDTVLRAMHNSETVWPLLFDKIYASNAPSFRSTPNALLQEAVAGRIPGEALEVCMGEGRNVVYLATQGWRVTGFDVSKVGLERARARADALGVPLDTVLQTSSTFAYGVARWDLIALIYAPIPVTDASYVEQLRHALKPGGLIVVESFAAGPSITAKRPVEIDPEALAKAYAGFNILRFEETYDLPDWTNEQEQLVRLIAAKP
jgi:SAM-dependent methyltransferase